jgi:hypothetical protein
MANDPDKTIRDGNRVAQFLADPTVQEAFDRLERRVYTQFKSSLTPETRLEAWAKARVIDELKIELRAVVDSSVLETSKLQKQERLGRLK